ncbi:MAG: bifunctional UDP-N-acetylglucosamine diphosphorylase/glucosamine-1-phosphate N-acetyltransferase GlmU [Oscillospiraceae bacterium]|nr:bifunctional UDP-N-acetylglucosamine diphosphorylase/glucosamine-1-phosphate N-acetyltransferase GlmU [Oscillospiraceae bacterium]
MKSAVILAGGSGKRMKTDKPKVLHEVLGKPMLEWVIDSCRSANVDRICVVKGFASEMIDEYILNSGYGIETALQSERLGTGHAVMMAEDFIKQDLDGDVIVLNGDAPFIDADTILASFEEHKSSGAGATVITARVDNPFGYGRIKRDGNGILGIVEQKDCTEDEVLIDEINSGCYWFKASDLLSALPRLRQNNAQNEFYLTDTLGIILSDGKKVEGYIAKTSDVVLGANDRKGLLKLSDIAREKIIDKHLENGVEFVSTDGVVISPDAVIGEGTKILPNTMIMGKSVIGKSCVVGPNSRLTNIIVGDSTGLDNVVAVDSKIGSNVSVGPFVQLRPNSVIEDYAHIGDFVEIKNSVIGKGTSVSHLTYVGDSDVGKNVNFGCGVVTVNYDGSKKARCVIKDNAFIGCNTNLVAPVTIGEAAYTAAGSTVTKDVPDYALAIERTDLEIKKDYALKKLTRHLEKGKRIK